MKEFMITFINDYGTVILELFITIILGRATRYFERLYKTKINTDEKKQIVKTCVSAVEQIFTDLHGYEKYDKSVEYISEWLFERGITITETELKMLIESAVREMKIKTNVSIPIN